MSQIDLPAKEPIGSTREEADSSKVIMDKSIKNNKSSLSSTNGNHHQQQQASSSNNNIWQPGKSTHYDEDISEVEDNLKHSLELTMNGLGPKGPNPPAKLRGWARIEAFIENLIHTNRFFHKIGSRIWLPLAFHSGLAMKKLDPHNFTYVLPFRRFNKNWYNAMAGAALVANSEIAAGMYLCAELGGKWTVVCKNLSYKFLRPCFGPAIYRVVPIAELKERLIAGNEFNLDMVLDILQQVKNHGKQPRVGRCQLTFHCTPKDGTGNSHMLIRAKSRKKK